MIFLIIMSVTPSLYGQSSIDLNALPSNLNVGLDLTHGVNNGKTTNFANSLLEAGSTFDSTISGPTDDLNVLLYAGPSRDILQVSTAIGNWFTLSDDPRLLWIAGESDYDGTYDPRGANGILAVLGSNIRMSKEEIQDPVFNDGDPRAVVSNVPKSDGLINSVITQGVSSIIMHGTTSVLGYANNSVLDLRYEDIVGVEIIMESSSSALSFDLDITFSFYDYYSYYGGETGNYPMVVIEQLAMDKFIILTGEVIFSDEWRMYDTISYESYQGNEEGWGNHDGKRLVDNILSWFGSVVDNPDLYEDYLVTNKHNDFGVKQTNVPSSELFLPSFLNAYFFAFAVTIIIIFQVKRRISKI